MNDLFNNPILVVSALVVVFVILPVLLFVYLPRAEEIASLRRLLSEKDAIIDRMTRNQTQAELAHTADRQWYAAQIEYARKDEGDAHARAKQHQDIADQIARAHGRLAGKGEAA